MAGACLGRLAFETPQNEARTIPALFASSGTSDMLARSNSMGLHSPSVAAVGVFTSCTFKTVARLCRLLQTADVPVKPKMSRYRFRVPLCCFPADRAEINPLGRTPASRNGVNPVENSIRRGQSGTRGVYPCRGITPRIVRPFTKNCMASATSSKPMMRTRMRIPVSPSRRCNRSAPLRTP